MSGLTMHLFGRPRVVLAPDVLVRFPTHKAQDLFCYLVLGRTHWHSRDALAGQFWADLPERQARKALRTTLWRVRALLENGRRGEGEYMMVESDEICFNAASEYWLDVQEFEHCISAARSSQTGSEDAEFSSLEPLTRAVELYQGDLMQGCYEDWCLYERERQREMYLGALGKLTALHHASGSYEEALRCGLRILSYDPLLEEVQREVMRLHCLAGNRAAAVRQYQLCRAALAKELAIEPMEETTALYAQICRGELIPTGVGRPTRPRQAESTAPGTPGGALLLPPRIDQALSDLRRAQAELDHLGSRLRETARRLGNLEQDLGQGAL